MILAPAAKAGLQDAIMQAYPSEIYMIGTAEVRSSGDIYKDKRKTEIMARLEIAKQIRVSVKSNALDVMCEGQGKILFGGVTDCRNQLVEVIETSVDEVLQGSRIVEHGEDKSRGVYFSVAVLPRKDAAIKAEEHYNEAVRNAREFLANAKSIKNDELKQDEVKKAKKELFKVMTFMAEQAVIEKTKMNADEVFTELEKEILQFEN